MNVGVCYEEMTLVRLSSVSHNKLFLDRPASRSYVARRLTKLEPSSLQGYLK